MSESTNPTSDISPPPSSPTSNIPLPTSAPRGRPATHGLRRRKLYIAPEDAERFIHFRHDMICELDPQDNTEHFFAEQIIAKRWLLLHADEAETAAMRNAFAASETHTAFLMESNSPRAPKDDDQRYDLAIAATCTNDKVHLVLRYRTTHERAMFRFETALRQYRTMRDATSEPTTQVGGQPPLRDSLLAPTPAGIPSRDDPSESESPNPVTNSTNPTTDAPQASSPKSQASNNLRPIQTNCRNSNNAPPETPPNAKIPPRNESNPMSTSDANSIVLHHLKSLPMSACPKDLLDTVIRHFNCPVGTIHKMNDTTTLLHLVEKRGIPEAILPAIERIPLGKGMAGLAAQRREPVTVCNLQTDQSGQAKPAAKLTGMEGSIAVPMLVDGKLCGVLGIAMPTAHQFTDSETTLLLKLATEIGIRIID